LTEPSDPSLFAFGSRVILKHLNGMLAEVEGVRLNQDIECVHRMRVASRRLREALDVFGPYCPQRKIVRWKKTVQKVTRSLGAARDTDVQIIVLAEALAAAQTNNVRPGLNRLLVRTRQQRSKQQHAVLIALAELTASGIPADMQAVLMQTVDHELPPSSELYHAAEIAVRQKMREFLAYEVYIPHPEAAAELHAMRIAAKHFRYTMEIFSPLYRNELKPALGALKQAQELLGGLHDCDVWGEQLPIFCEKEQKRVLEFYGKPGPFNFLKPGLEYFRLNRLEERNQNYNRFTEKWAEWKAAALWQQIIDWVSAPLLDLDAVYPPPAKNPE